MQRIATNCDSETTFIYFKNRGKERFNVASAEKVNDCVNAVPREGKHSEMVQQCQCTIGGGHEPILLATGKCLTGRHVDSKPSTEVVESSLTGRKLWLLSHGSRSAASLMRRPEQFHIRNIIEVPFNHRYNDLLYCVQEPSDTVCYPARSKHFTVSVSPKNGWKCLLNHIIKYNEAEAAEM